MIDLIITKFNSLINSFKVKEVPVDNDLPDWHVHKKSYGKFKQIILKHLENRDNLSPDDLFDNDQDFPHYQKWVVEMCREILDNMDNDDVELKDIISLDTYSSGHIDYVKKFALRLAELEYGTPKAQIYT